ncbi:hypothetical protein Q8A67_023974 [Cirrhinus molitorella]|uniref:Fibronectin type-III domain-containing protein n=1 Tax=Cirrhinus molitorella TaxID=172907 RepID=A0AA88TD16_9TELE|nr:hypothetical protein Q8A67_023974 [Cirrhinus molitorella]
MSADENSVTKKKEMAADTEMTASSATACNVLIDSCHDYYGPEEKVEFSVLSVEDFPSLPSTPLKPPPKRGRVIEQITSDGVVVKVSPSCDATKELKLLYKMKEDWKYQSVLQGQSTVTLTDLRPDTEYEIKYTAAGKLNYIVDSDVIGVTTHHNYKRKSCEIKERCDQWWSTYPSDSIREAFQVRGNIMKKLLKNLGLEEYYDKKLNLHTVLQIDKSSVTDTTVQSLSDLPWLFLKRLMMLQRTARSVKCSSSDGAEDSESDDDQETESDCSQTSLKTELSNSIRIKLDAALSRRNGMMKVEGIQKTYMDTMEKKVLDLLKLCRENKSVMSDSMLNKAFEKMWQETVSTLSYTGLQKQDIIKRVLLHLRKNLESRGSSMAQNLDKVTDLNNYGQEKFVVYKDKWKITKWYYKSQIKIVQEMSDNLISDCWDFVNTKNKSEDDYDDTYIREILNKINEKLKAQEDLELKEDFELSLKLHICGFASREFQKIHNQFIQKNNPQTALENFKQSYQSDFIDLYQKENVTAVMSSACSATSTQWRNMELPENFNWDVTEDRDAQTVIQQLREENRQLKNTIEGMKYSDLSDETDSSRCPLPQPRTHSLCKAAKKQDQIPPVPAPRKNKSPIAQVSKLTFKETENLAVDDKRTELTDEELDSETELSSDLSKMRL